MFELKTLSREGVATALKKAERYRLLNEPSDAESICRDVLAAEPENHEARVGLILALSDQLARESSPGPAEPRALLDELDDAYERAYYDGIICERQAKAHLGGRGGPAAGFIAYDWLRRAMDRYEEALSIRAEGGESALLRWNTCARLLNRHEHLRPAPEDVQTMLE